MSHENLSVRRTIASLAAALVAVPAVVLPFAPPAQAQIPNPLNAVKNMSTKQKVVALAGVALLYYLYKKHQANQAANAAPAAGGVTQPATVANNARRPQLYRSKNGGVYYRDGNGKAVWLTVPSRPVQVPVSDVQRYAPDYSRYQGQRAPSAPRGYRTQPFDQFDPNLNNYGTSSVPNAPMNNSVPGPR